MTVAAPSQASPLTGFTVGVTAARRADELGALLERRGATVQHAPAIRIVPLPDDEELLRATEQLLAGPVDVVVATTGIGFRGWLDAASGWGHREALVERCRAATVYTRGPKAKGAVRAAELTEAWSPPSEGSAELLDYMLKAGVEGKRIAVQLHGAPLPEFVDPLRAAGADVLEVPVYRWLPPADPAPMDRLVDGILGGSVDAITFTSAPAADNFLRRARETGRYDRLIDALRDKILVCCVGSITAVPMMDLGIPARQPDRARLGAMARLLTEDLAARSVHLEVGRKHLEIRGQAVLVNGALKPVAPAPMAMLRALMARPGTVVGRDKLLRALPGGGEEHAVETAIGRLRSALGEPQLVRTVVKRGYQLAVER
ncbi:uroporphyrinogen-III synthase [Pseudonocardiaceae bacterium YIM PH 21723]|nr:uroporphyrinogen-III synthase [Pseudonocardiaceae bacterium YIM PH 21723]